MPTDFGQLPAGATVLEKPVSEQPRLKAPPAPSFIYFYHPTRWDVDPETCEVFPILGKLKKDPGNNGVSSTGNIRAAKMNMEEKGWIEIPPDCIEGGYCVLIRVGAKGPIYASRWEHPQIVGDQLLGWKRDDAGWRNFMRFLVEEGYVKPPTEVVLQRLIDRLERRQDNRLQNLHVPKVKAAYERDEKLLEKTNEAIEKALAAGDVVSKSDVETNAVKHAGELAAEAAKSAKAAAEVKRLKAAQRARDKKFKELEAQLAESEAAKERALADAAKAAAPTEEA